MTPGVNAGTCKTCALPLVWSDDRQRVWCAVYGDHPRTGGEAPKVTVGNVMRPAPRHLRAVS